MLVEMDIRELVFTIDRIVLIEQFCVRLNKTEKFYK